MQQRPPKSAPGRIKSKKTSALKDIEEWVVGDVDASRDTTRHAGQLAENVTEERLLRARLMELGKERFKFLTKYAYERQTFADKQKRKIATMLKNRVSTGSGRVRPLFSADATDPNIEIPGTPIQRSLAALIRPKTVQFESDMHKSYISTGSDDSRPNTVSGAARASLRRPDYDSFQQVESSIPLIAHPSDWSRPSTAGTVSYSRSTSTLGMDSKDKKLNKYGNKFKGVTSDPRYAKLEAALSLNYISNTKLDVKTIIEAKESLRRPARTGTKEARRALEVKIKQFMKENGIVF